MGFKKIFGRRMTNWASREPVIGCSVYQGPPYACHFSLSLPLLQSVGIGDTCEVLWGDAENRGQCVIRPGSYYKLDCNIRNSPHLRLLRIISALPDWLTLSHRQQILEHEVVDGEIIVTFPADFIRDPF